MNFFDNHYYRINKLLLSSVGLWPYQSSISRLTTLTVATLGLLSFCVPQVIYILKHRNSLDAILESMPMALGGLIFAIKMASMLNNFPEVKILLERVYNDWMHLSDNKEMKMIEQYAEGGRMFAVYYTVLVGGLVFLYALVPLSVPILDILFPLNNSRARTLPHPVEYFIDQEKYYYPILVNVYFGYVIGSIVILSIDSLYIVFLRHVCGIFAIICCRLENLSDNSSEKKENTDELYYCTVECVQLHIKNIESACLIQSTFGPILFVDIAVGIVLHSVACVMIVIYMERPSEIARFASIVLAESSRLCFSSWLGQILIDLSTEVSNTAYNAAWYRMHPKSAKLIKLIMLRSQTPCSIIIGGIYNINMDSFAMVMKASMSYSAVFASLRETNNT